MSKEKPIHDAFSEHGVSTWTPKKKRPWMKEFPAPAQQEAPSGSSPSGQGGSETAKLTESKSTENQSTELLLVSALQLASSLDQTHIKPASKVPMTDDPTEPLSPQECLGESSQKLDDQRLPPTKNSESSSASKSDPQTVSKSDTVIKEQCQKSAEIKVNPIKNGQSSPASSQSNSSNKVEGKLTLSKNDTVDFRQSTESTVSIINTVSDESGARELLFTAPKEPTVSKLDTVGFRQSHKSTVSAIDAVDEPLLPKTKRPTQSHPEPSVSKSDTVHFSPSNKSTAADPDKVSQGGHNKKEARNSLQGSLKINTNFIPVPNSLLRANMLFSKPIDFMVYLFLFGYSYGFGRNTCDMGQQQLMSFTGASKNTIKESLDRLSEQKWISQLSEYEYGHVTRKWRIYSPFEKGASSSQDFVSTVIESDTVSFKQGHEAPLTGSKTDTDTVSKNDTYKENTKNNLNKTLSQEVLSYLEDLRPARKREREREALASLEKTFNPEEIAAAFEFVRTRGTLEGGQDVHSPLAYLAVAMDDVLTVLRAEQLATQRVGSMQQNFLNGAESTQTSQISNETAFQTAEAAFYEAFLDSMTQESTVRQILARSFPALSAKFSPNVPFVRRVAILQWFNEHKDQTSSSPNPANVAPLEASP